MVILTTAHAHLTRGCQEALISGPKNQWLARTRGPWHPTFNYSMHRKSDMYTPTMSIVPSLATSWNLDSVGHVKVGHPHPPHRPTSCVDHVAILVAGITCGCALLQYPVLFLCTPLSKWILPCFRKWLQRVWYSWWGLCTHHLPCAWSTVQQSMRQGECLSISISWCFLAILYKSSIDNRQCICWRS